MVELHAQITLDINFIKHSVSTLPIRDGNLGVFIEDSGVWNPMHVAEDNCLWGTIE